MFSEDEFIDMDNEYVDYSGYDKDEPLLCGCNGPHCVACGCCEHQACDGGCIWATPNLCSRCVRCSAKAN